MNWSIRFLIPLFLILAAAQIGRFQAQETRADLSRLVIVGDSVSASRMDKISHGDSLTNENASWSNRVTESRL